MNYYKTPEYKAKIHARLMFDEHLYAATSHLNQLIDEIAYLSKADQSMIQSECIDLFDKLRDSVKQLADNV